MNRKSILALLTALCLFAGGCQQATTPPPPPEAGFTKEAAIQATGNPNQAPPKTPEERSVFEGAANPDLEKDNAAASGTGYTGR
jgi:hypothetical protein